ncbi:MAG: hypothetical protein J5949_05240 [Oscillospiraceae bacterium]|nr:hypothetical protein [Oscillospiraceae bacterium]
METRYGKITACRAGGTAGNGAKTYKLSIPSSWVGKLGLDGENRVVVLSFDGDQITVHPVQSMEQYRQARLAAGHALLRLRYYNHDTLCTLIYADRTAKDLRAENYTDQLIKTAFGKNQLPGWEDLEEFLQERCIPRERAGLRQYLEALGLDEYDPLAIIRKTKGRMAEDDQWLEVEELA